MNHKDLRGILTGILSNKSKREVSLANIRELLEQIEFALKEIPAYRPNLESNRQEALRHLDRARFNLFMADGCP